MNQRKIIDMWHIVAGTLLSALIMFVNRYPLVYSDTGSYIYSGFTDVYFSDRPFLYGMFMRHTSMATSLFWVVLAQSLLVTSLLFITLKFFVKIYYRVLFLPLLIVLIVFTGYSYTVSILIPDIFTALSFLAFINLVFNNESNGWKRMLFSILFYLSLCTQFSSMPVFCLMFVFAVCYFIFFAHQSVKIAFQKILLPLSIFVLSIFTFLVYSYNKTGKIRVSGASNVFIVNHLLETGILEKYLERNCSEKNFKICAYRDQLNWEFIWSQESPVQRTGGWEANDADFQEIINDVLTNPEYLKMLFVKSIEYTVVQFFSFNIEVPAPQLIGSPPYDQIKWHFEDSRREYLSSLQSRGKLQPDLVNFLQLPLVIVSIVFMIWALSTSFWRRLDEKLRASIFLLFVFLLSNAFVCSNLSTIDSRFQSRLMWLIPFFAFIFGIKIIRMAFPELVDKLLKRFSSDHS